MVSDPTSPSGQPTAPPGQPSGQAGEPQDRCGEEQVQEQQVQGGHMGARVGDIIILGVWKPQIELREKLSWYEDTVFLQPLE